MGRTARRTLWLGLALLGASPGWSQQPLPENQLLFVHYEGGADPAQITANLWRLQVDQPEHPQAVTQAQNPALSLGSPVLSRDRRRVAFTSNLNLTGSLESISAFVMNADGTGLHQVTGFGTVDPLPGPTGTLTGRVQAASLAGAGGPTIGSCIVSAPGAPTTASCSPDGTFTLPNVPVGAGFVKVQAQVDYAGVGGAPGLSFGFTPVTVQAGQVTDVGTITLQPGDARSLEPSWSRDGTQLVVTNQTSSSVVEPSSVSNAPEFRASIGQHLAIWSVDGQLVRVLSIPDHPEIPLVGSDWSPVEDRIACGAWGSPTFLLLLDPDGSHLQAIYQAPADLQFVHLVTQCRWSPDGTRIAFLQSAFDINTQAAWSDLYVVNRDGSGLQQITANAPGQFVDSPTWSPDGGSIAFGLEKQGNAGVIESANLFLKQLGQPGFTQLTTDGRSDQPAW